MKVKTITDYLETLFPLSLAYDWDRCGLQVGSLQQDISKVIIALSVDSHVIQECIDKDIDLLITHHPLFFIPINLIETESEIGKIIKMALTHDITIYSLHTCMDRGMDESMNKWLIETLGLSNYENFNDEGLIKVATIDETLESLINHVKKSYQLSTIAYVGNLQQPLKKLAIIGGSGADFIDELAGKVDVLITGDVGYHDAQNALGKNLSVIDVGHFAENIMVSKVKQLLEKQFDLDIYESVQTNYIKYR